MTSTQPAGSAVSVPVFAPLGVLRGRRLVVAVVVLALLAVVAWSEWNSTSIAPTTNVPAVSGVVVQEGGPPPLPGQSDIRPLRSMPLVVTGTTAAGTGFWRHVSTDSHGRFALKVPPGIYTITAEIHSPNPTGFLPHAKVTVIRGHPVHVRITSYVF
jgi:hypothetical protein